MPTFSPAKQDVRDLVAEVMAAYHEELITAEVTVSTLMAHPTEKEREKGPPPYLKLHGYPAAAVVKATPYERRVQGVQDVTLKVDRMTWDELDDAGRVALIDHELEHIEIRSDDEGGIATDDCGRPKIGMRLHDHQIGVFRSIINRHGIKSLDAQQVVGLFKAYKQKFFSFADDQAEQDPMPDVAGAIGR